MQDPKTRTPGAGEAAEPPSLAALSACPSKEMWLQSLLKMGLIFLIVFLCVLICVNHAFFVNKEEGDVGVWPWGLTSPMVGDNVGLLMMRP